MKKVVVIGLGSMGNRRIRLMRKINNDLQIIGVDNNPERRKSCETQWQIPTYCSLKELLQTETVEAAFVCTAPLSHNYIINECLQAGLHVFTELNLVEDGYKENIEQAKQKKLVLFLSSTFLYREEIKYIKEATQEVSCKLNYTYHVGQYLPDWHPWENYKGFFVSDKRSSGCREIFAIELPWLTDTFGEIVDMTVVKDKISSLDVNYNDNYLVLVQHATGHKGVLAVDIVSRKAVRNLEVFGELFYLRWDGSPTGLFRYNFDEKMDENKVVYHAVEQLADYSSFVVENAYANEILNFFEVVAKGGTMKYTFEKDRDILKLIDRIEV
ncbi:Gfo/Idh/MocA family protein [Anaeromusa acidaminophila]|uniref:Gfo/Idh/MocA family protein n=1 Tax=Anaeromusa acidaminophila TaxID=81464 RepID=UPI00037A0853|nr:Gfo/Idh/MocA family oxidoreductase [Anaeromusa acidaminophila]